MSNISKERLPESTMLSFDTLPPEIILLIARFVGGGYFRAGADRLLVCKAWLVLLVRVSILTWTDPNPSIRYKVAQSVAFEDLALTIDMLQRFWRLPIVLTPSLWPASNTYPLKVETLMTNTM